MTVVEIDGPAGLARCRGEDGDLETVEIALIEAVTPGDWLLVHAGTAIARLDTEGAIAGA
jgi:hydrogenase maturation factor